mmetsp:Transcript_28746/g.52380  ORF Transcript_28746/g.52380 Transcript_28746/m.52380 type:complete len:163 (+) Transcript_28746:60-548(+)
MPVELAPNVEYDVMAREWRCTWSSADAMDSLKECQQVLDKHADKLGLIAGCWTRSANRSTDLFSGKMDPHRQGIQRIVSADTREFKIITKLPIEQFKAWEDKGFEPEAQFLADLRSIPGVANIDTETYTIAHINLAAKSSGRCRVPSASRGCMASSLPQATS